MIFNYSMILIVGLGNPGIEYKFTRHNLGFQIIDTIQKEMDFPEFELKKQFHSLTSIKKIGDKIIILLKPETFMNNSGGAVKAIKRYYNIPLKNIVIIHDELDINLGKFKIKKNQRAAGHKGVESIIQSLKSQNFWRVRVGIESRNILQKRTQPGIEYVLQDFSLLQKTQLIIIFDQVIKEIKKLSGVEPR
jgi:PTH1 family peptidyl-tRNA hydrolase